MSKFRRSKAVQKNQEQDATKNLLWIDPGIIHEDEVNKEIYEDEDRLEEFEELKRDIKENGIAQPLLVRPHEKLPLEYIVVSGHRRLKALKELGEKAPCLVRNVENKEDYLRAKISLIATNQLVRKRTPGEIAREVKLLKDYIEELRGIEPSYKGIQTRDLIARENNMSSRQVQRYLTIDRNLNDNEKEQFYQGDLTMDEALDLAKKKKEEKKKMRETIFKNEKIHERGMKKEEEKKKSKKEKNLPIGTIDQLAETISTKTRFNNKEIQALKRLQKILSEII